MKTIALALTILLAACGTKPATQDTTTNTTKKEKTVKIPTKDFCITMETEPAKTAEGYEHFKAKVMQWDNTTVNPINPKFTIQLTAQRGPMNREEDYLHRWYGFQVEGGLDDLTSNETIDCTGRAGCATGMDFIAKIRKAKTPMPNDRALATLWLLDTLKIKKVCQPAAAYQQFYSDTTWTLFEGFAATEAVHRYTQQQADVDLCFGQ